MKTFTRKAFLCLIVAVCLLLPGGPPSVAAALPEGSPYSVAFSPQGESLELVLSCIRAAERNILVAAYSFTSKPVALALIEAWERGVNVKVMADKKGNSSRHTAVTHLASQGIPVRLNGNYAIHHHKFMVIDGRHVQTGSFNYSAAAVKKNAENVLVLWNEPELAGQYAAEWQRLWDEGG
jgi:phosphatidylserine/phosphatidylglycerophosphate/cardiolipin synthase-like enzyme